MVVVVALSGWLVRVSWLRRARCKSRLVVLAWWGHGFVNHMLAGEDGGRECGCEAEDLAAPFEDAFVQSLQLFGCGRDELAGISESWD